MGEREGQVVTTALHVRDSGSVCRKRRCNNAWDADQGGCQCRRRWEESLAGIWMRKVIKAAEQSNAERNPGWSGFYR